MNIPVVHGSACDPWRWSSSYKFPTGLRYCLRSILPIYLTYLGTLPCVLILSAVASQKQTPRLIHFYPVEVDDVGALRNWTISHRPFEPRDSAPPASKSVRPLNFLAIVQTSNLQILQSVLDFS
jgi:hypothetical protein